MYMPLNERAERKQQLERRDVKMCWQLAVLEDQMYFSMDFKYLTWCWKMHV